MATALDAWKDGVQRVRKAPAILIGAFAITVFSTLPMAFVLHASIATHLGNSMAAVEAVEGFNLDWWQEFSTQTSSLSETFSPSIIGFAATLNNLSSILDGQLETPAIAWALGINFLIWTFLFGGIIDRYARQHATKASGFFTTSGVFFFRFLRLAVISLGVYWFLFSLVHGWIFNNWYSWATHEVTVERTAFFWRLIMYVIFGTLLVIVNIVFDYAKIRAVVEDRRSMLGALLSAIRFIIRHPGRIIRLYLLNGAIFIGLILLWSIVAPGAKDVNLTMWLGLIAAQMYVLARLFVKLLFVASQTSLFQASLAHARYTAKPVAKWPESPAVTAIDSNR